MQTCTLSLKNLSFVIVLAEIALNFFFKPKSILIANNTLIKIT